MQDFHPLFDGYPAFLPQETDTAIARSPVPIYYIHSLAHPFCGNTLCACHRGSRDIARLFGYLTEGVDVRYILNLSIPGGAVFVPATGVPFDW